MAQTPSQDELLALAHKTLSDSLQTLGVNNHAQGRVVVCDDAPVQIYPYEVYLSSEGRVVSLAMQVKLGDWPDAPVISEAIAGFSDNLESAMNNAVMNWMFSVLLAALAWFDAEGCPAHMASVHIRDLPDATGRSKTWRIVSSPAVAMGEFDGTPEQLDTKETLAPLFEELARTPQIHWVKVMVAHPPDSEATSDCTVDNETSEAGKQLLVSSPTLPKAPILRQFHILCPADQVQAKTAPPRVAEKEPIGPQPQPRKGFWSRSKH